MLESLDGRAFSRAVRAGALAVVREREALDRMNVFPVPDADTGANLAATLRAAALELGAAETGGVGAVARAAADGALDGARGNSGAIFAQFLHGLAAGIAHREHADSTQFAVAAAAGADAAYAALLDPREGTILTVLRAWSDELRLRAAEEDFVEFWRGALVAARHALAGTPRQLEVLARNRVVDAGGQGFVLFLEGILESLQGGPRAAGHFTEAPARGLPPSAVRHEGIDTRYRYCAEALLTARAGHPLTRDEVAAAVLGQGASLVIAGGGARLRVHLHTNAPQHFLASVAALGDVERCKVDDMFLQQLGGRAAAVALVTDSTTDLPDDVAFDLGVVAVPLTLSIGDEEYLDGVDITAQGFAAKVAAGAGVPRSSQPAVTDFAETYQRLLEYREGVVSVHIAGAMSGTVQAARRAAAEVDPQRIRVVDSCSVSVGAGLVLEAAGEAIGAGAGLDEVAAAAERATRDVRVFGTVATLDDAVRGGRVSRRMARTLTLLHLVPIIVFDETGKAGKGGVALGFDRALAALVRRSLRFVGDRPATAMVVHSGDEAGADFVAARLAERLERSVPVVCAGAVLATHVGPGSVSVAVRRLDDDA